MAIKKGPLTDEQKAAIRNANLTPRCWKVRQEFLTSLMIVHIFTGEVRVIDKVRRK